MTSITWDITNECNLRCKHCYNADKYFNKKVIDLTNEECKCMIELLKKSGVNSVSILGGEPFKRKDILDILQYLTANNISISLTSNGTLLDENLIFELAKLNLKRIYISLDGFSSEKNDFVRGIGTFNMVNSNISKLIKIFNDYSSSTEIFISTVATSYNAKDLYKAVDLCKDLSVKSLSITTLINAGNAKGFLWNKESNSDYFDVLDGIELMVQHASEVNNRLEIKIDTRPIIHYYLNLAYPVNIYFSTNYTMCSALNGNLYITANGDIHPCGLYDMQAGKDREKERYFNHNDGINISSVKKIEDILNNKYYEDFITGMKQLEKNSYYDYCEECEVKEYCYPCPYQFTNVDMYKECEWAHNKLSILKNKFINYIVVDKKHNKYINFLKEIKVKKIFEMLEKDLTVYKNYEKYIYRTDTKLELLEYFEHLKQFEKMFLIKINRSMNYDGVER